MSKKFGVITIHGMGTQGEGYHESLTKRLESHLLDEVKEDMAFVPLYYHDQMQGQQADIWKEMQKEEIDWKSFRKFFLYYFSDATTSEHRPERENSVYKKVQYKIRDTLNTLYQDVGGEDVPLVIIAHSLGCQVLSNYIWDAQKNTGIWENETPTNFQKFGTLRYFFTSGCNIPFFVSGFDEILAIDKPNPDFEWLNYYDRDDMLGWPLRPLSSSYRNLIKADIEINTGITPLSHMNYWKDKDFIHPIVDKIKSLHASLP